ncbi:MAG: zinc ribbon domain-containing protein [Candidatus Helarchaeota archaeon]|nr:zinc ribbon domain-containing protein [Candidatus Helarchaeota archaeon]
MSSEDRYEQRLERKMKKKRRYKGRSEYLGAYGIAAVFTFIGMLSIIFYFTPFDFIGLSAWGYWMFIPAFFLWIGGIATHVRYNQLRRDVLATLDNYKSGPISIDSLTAELMMERPSLMRLLIDLRVERRLKFRVDSKSGEVILGESYLPPVIDAAAAAAAPTGTFFCPQCGQRIASDSVFCPNCGASVQ